MDKVCLTGLRLSLLTMEPFSLGHPPGFRSAATAHKTRALEPSACLGMSFSHTHGTGMHSTTPPPRRDKDLAGSAGSRTSFKGPLKPHLANGKKGSHSSGSSNLLPLGEHVNGLENRSHQSQPRGDKVYQDTHTFGETPAPQNGIRTTPDKTRRTGSAASTPFKTPSRTRTKRKRVVANETSDSEEMVTAAEESGRAVNGLTNGSESSRRESQRPNGVPLRRQDSGQFTEKPPTQNNRLSEDEFDSLIYAQTDRPRPPLGSLFERKGPSRRGQEHGMSSGLPPCLHIRMDPRIHWTHERSEEWHKRKQEEIRFRGTRKENFGKAAQRMQAKRQREALISRALPEMPVKNDAGFGRPMDFGDVPEAELPEMVQSNPAWLRAAAWMRRCRDKSLDRQREIAGRQEAGLPWKGRIGASGIR